MYLAIGAGSIPVLFLINDDGGASAGLHAGRDHERNKDGGGGGGGDNDDGDDGDDDDDEAESIFFGSDDDDDDDDDDDEAGSDVGAGSAGYESDDYNVAPASLARPALTSECHPHLTRDIDLVNQVFGTGTAATFEASIEDKIGVALRLDFSSILRRDTARAWKLDPDKPFLTLKLELQKDKS
eukprot:COSAG05_NODE_4364_length_1549_cov_44.082759_2_plen_183_part_00